MIGRSSVVEPTHLCIPVCTEEENMLMHREESNCKPVDVGNDS